MTRHYWIGACLMACAFAALAGGGPAAVRKQVEASMLVTGTIDIEADGSVAGHALDQPKMLEAGVIELVDRTLPSWKFEPVLKNGKAHKATAKMSLLIVANKLDGGKISVRIRSADFREADRPESNGVSKEILTPPRYPSEAMRNAVQGVVYLVIRVNRKGEVVDAAAEQVNLRAVDTPHVMEHWRGVLAKASLKAARAWRFNPPTTGPDVDDEFWSAYVPVDYQFIDDPSSKYGQWRAYIPGPRQTIPWVNEAGDDIASSPDALVAGEVYQIGQGLHLLTPLGEG